MKVSISNSEGQGKFSISYSALVTKLFNFKDSYLLTIETNPSNSALALIGSK